MLKTILLIDDNREHFNDGFRLCHREGFPINRALWGAQDLTEALERLNRHGKGDGFGVLTDLYFPSRFYGFTPDGEKRQLFAEMQPLGLLIMSECRARGIPCVIVTAGHHHGAKYHEAAMAVRAMSWPEMVDSSNDVSGEAPTKNWGLGLQRLREISDAVDQSHADPSQTA